MNAKYVNETVKNIDIYRLYLQESRPIKHSDFKLIFVTVLDDFQISS